MMSHMEKLGAWTSAFAPRLEKLSFPSSTHTSLIWKTTRVPDRTRGLGTDNLPHMKQSSRKSEEDSPAGAGRAGYVKLQRSGDEGGGREKERERVAEPRAPKRVEVSKLARISEDQGSRMELGSLARI